MPVQSNMEATMTFTIAITILDINKLLILVKASIYQSQNTLAWKN